MEHAERETESNKYRINIEKVDKCFTLNYKAIAESSTKFSKLRKFTNTVIIEMFKEDFKCFQGVSRSVSGV